MDDITMNAGAAYGSDRWCAVTLGKSYDWFKKSRHILEGDGFPPKDRILGLRLKDDVHAWIAKRRRIADVVVAPFTTSGAQPNKENLHAF